MIRNTWLSKTLLGLVLIPSLSCLSYAQGSDRVVKATGYVSVDAIRPGDKFNVAVAVEIGDGYHINAHRPTLDYLIATTLALGAPAGISFADEKYPAPSHRKFEFQPDTPLAVHEGTIFITAEAQADNAIRQGVGSIKAMVTVQACNDKQCLAPSDLAVEIPIKFAASRQTVKPINAEVFAKASAQPDSSTEAPSMSAGLVEYQGSSQSERLFAGSLVSILIGVFIAGLLLNTTPCVYPIIPITIGFFVNQGAREGKPKISKTFLMASMYVLGMALTYSLLGVIAAKSGGLFGAALQNPIVLIALAAIMVGLSLSMFGVYEFRLPEALNRMATSSTQSTSGMFGAFVMGLTMGIVAAPCIGPFVLALLVEVGTKGSAAYGFMLFFVLALGLGFPYLVLGTFSGALKTLPRSGLWMVTVRKVFGLVLIGMALYFLMPLMGAATAYIFVTFFAACALYLIFWEAGRTKPSQFGWVLRAIGVGAAAVAVIMALPKKIEAEIQWQTYSEQALADARREGKGVIIDTFADWCIPCKELDQATFTNVAVKKDAERFVTLKLDLTRSEAGSEAARAKAKFGIRGVPTVIFLDHQGKERSELRLEGFEKPSLFLQNRMQKVVSPVGDASLALAKNAGDSKAPLSDAATGSAVEPAPAISLNLLNGGTLALESLRGKVAVVDFWATWCVPCLSEIPMFNQLKKDYQAKGVEVIAISLDEEGASKVKPFLKEHPMDYNQTIGDKTTANAFNVDDSTLPVTLLIDKQGRIRFRHVGITKKDVLEVELNQLLSE
ncbi:MAG TPA: cytochrome c biogenesis protein CcdA [Blastocatellia bacterium]|nr:cytochrome c biogenesis protein CcdA [Blastocatellia bacterium]